MNQQDYLLKILWNENWRERQPEISKPVTNPKVYDTAEIYDNPAEHSTTRGIFAYTGVEII